MAERRTPRSAKAGLALLVALACPAAPARAQGEKPAATPPATVVVATGVVTGLYFPVGGAICRMVNLQREENGLRCLVEPTEGSVANLAALKAGEAQFALVQSDWQRLAAAGEGRYSGTPFKELRSVLNLHGETLTLLARPDAEISGLEGLKGKRVNLGPKGSSLRALAEVVLAAAAVQPSALAEAGDATPDAALKALCEGQIDAAVFAVGHPNGAVREALSGCAAVPLPIGGAGIDKLLADRPELSRGRIPAEAYPGLQEDVPTVAVQATLVTTAAVGDPVVQAVARAVLGQLEAFRAEHPALSLLRAEELTAVGAMAPVHPGAERAIKDAAKAQ